MVPSGAKKQATFDHCCGALGGDFLVLLTQNLNPGVGNLTTFFAKKSNPRPMPCLPPRRLNIDRCISRFVDLQSSNMYSWSIRWWKLQLVVQVYAGEVAHFCHSFTLGK